MVDLFGQVIEISLSMSVLILLLFIFSKALHKRYRASAAVFAWLAIALRLILPWNISLPSAAVTIPIPQTMVQPHPVASVFTETLLPEMTEENAVPQIPQNAPADNPEKNNEESLSPASGFSLSAVQILTGIWILGMGFSLLRLILDYHQVKKLLMARGRRISRQSPQGRLLRQLCRKMQIRKIPPLMVSRSAPTPMAIGFFNPSIVLAPELLDHENLDLILMHELIHLKQKGLWKKVLLSAAQTIHWFNPLVWLMNNQAENDIEMACDQRLLKDQPKEVRAVYGRMIVDVIRQTRLPMTAFSTRFSSGKPLKKRIQALFDSSRKKKGTLILTLILLCAGMGSMLIACGVQAQPGQQEEQLLRISRNEDNAELMVQSEDPAVLETMQKVIERQRAPISEPYYYDLKIHFNGKDYLAWTNPQWLYLKDQQGKISYTDDPYALYDFYALIGYEQPEIKTGELTINPVEGEIAKITVADINSRLQPEKEVNWQWIQPHQYTYFDVFSDLHGEYVELGKNTWTNQNPEFKNDWLLTFVIHPGDQYTSYPFPEVIHICFLKGDLALINDWLVQLDHDYTEDIRELLSNLGETGSHFESTEDEAKLKKERIRNNFPWASIIEPVKAESNYIYNIPQMNLRITIDQEVPADVFMIYDKLSNEVGFQYYEWPIEDWMSSDYTHGSYDGYYVFGLFDEPPVDGGYFGDGALIATEVMRFSDTEILCITSDLGLNLTSEGTDYLKSVGFWPSDEKSMPLLNHLTFEKIR